MNESNAANVHLKLDGALVPVERDVFVALFHNSVMAGRAGVRDALAGNPLGFKNFVELARRAEIPYPLFFAPREADGWFHSVVVVNALACACGPS
jgi:hypothetical protein